MLTPESVVVVRLTLKQSELTLYNSTACPPSMVSASTYFELWRICSSMFVLILYFKNCALSIYFFVLPQGFWQYTEKKTHRYIDVFKLNYDHLASYVFGEFC